ncbi:MAG: SpvB/TcaC N-terminal domain-containing protein [Bradymonadia bacterium]
MREWLKRSTRPLTLTIGMAALALGTANAQTGISDDRVSLPEGPGSFEGVGDNALAVGNTGDMSYGVPFVVAPGYATATPSLGLSYSSSGGNGLVGMGWSMGLPHIERMTSKRLPDYTEDDTFIFGGTELVRISDGEPAEYRARFEGSFTRYFWHQRDVEGGGYWRVLLPDGGVAWYGADAAGQIDYDSRFEGAAGVFRWHLVEQQDKFDHPIRYQYTVLDARPYLSRVDYLFDTSGNANAHIELDYEARADLVSDARSGINEIMSSRLTSVRAYSGEAQFRRYDLTYEDYPESGGVSRLAGVEQMGLNGTPFETTVSFEYSAPLTVGDAVIVDMGQVGASPITGDATLVDLNGDALPDMVDTSQPGAHRIYLNTLQSDGTHQFGAAIESARGARAGHQLSSPYVQMLDIDGDGRADLVNVQTGQVLLNKGGAAGSDWSALLDLNAVDALPNFGADGEIGGDELSSIRFFDYDNDRRIDVIRSTDVSTEIFANIGDGFEQVQGIEALGYGFETSRLELSDITGDGLLDATVVAAGSLSYRVNLGHGRWSAERTIIDLPYTQEQLDDVELEDINGDSLDDIVIVRSGQIQFALNRGGYRFDAFETVNTAGGQALPEVLDNTSVLFADMNGSGSDDVVYIAADGGVQYVELFPQRPHLLTHITNSHGVTQRIQYTTAAEALAEDDTEWAYALPFPMLMVSRIDVSDTVTPVVETTTYNYRDAYYDADEKQFRGFAYMTSREIGDASQPDTVRIDTYDLGQADSYYNGLQLTSATYSGDDLERPMATVTYAYTDCAIGDAPANTTPPIRFVCKIAEETTVQEGGPASEAVTMRTELQYGDFGELIAETSLGVVSVGGSGCGVCPDDGLFGTPCGAQCLGDERYAERAFIAPTDIEGGRWIVGLPTHQRERGVANSDVYAETRFYYDGDGFEGLPAGSATLGLMARSEALVSADSAVTMSMLRYDAHGNVVEALDADAPGDAAGYRARTVYDDLGLLIVAEERENFDPEGNVYTLRRETTYEPVFGQPQTSSNWFVVGDDASPSVAEYRYDDFGRVRAVIMPGDDAATPSVEYDYAYEGSITSMSRRQRTTLNAADTERHQVQCFDAAGRLFQDRVRLGGDRYQVSDHVVLNSSGDVWRRYVNYEADGAGCQLEAPEGTPYFENTFDALGRPLSTTLPDGELFDGASSVRTMTYRPLTKVFTDAEDNAGEASSPTVRYFDGAGRLVRQTYMRADGEDVDYTYRYDSLGRVVRIIDPEGNVREQAFDLLGQLLWSEDADRGRTQYTYDEAGLIAETTDGAGRRVRQSHDRLKRRTAIWDPEDEAGTKASFLYDLGAQCPEGFCTHPAEALVGVNYIAGDHTVELWYGRDARRRIEQVRWVIDGVPVDASITYDNISRVISETYPGDITLDYTYDVGDRVSSIAGIVDAMAYSELGPLTSIQYANGVQETFDRNVLSQTTRRLVEGPDGAPVLDLAYQYNRSGLMAEIIDQAPPRAGPGRSARFTYDDLYRLVEADLDADRADFAETLSYTYSANSKLTSKSSSRGASSSLHQGAYTYGEGAGPNALTQAGELTFAYDAAGLMTRRGDTEYSWDYMGRLVSAQRDGEILAKYAYAPSGQRIIRESGAHLAWELTPAFEIEDGMLLAHVRHNSKRVATIEVDTLATSVLPNPMDDGVIDIADAVLTADSDTDAIAERSLSSSVRRMLLDGEQRITWYHDDHTRSTAAITDADGQVVEQRSYAPYGMARHTDSGQETSYGYTGRHTDRDIGLTYMGSRYYDPAVGRWTAPDPGLIVFSEGDLATPIQFTDSYGYTQGNPVNLYDADGNNAVGAFALAGVGLITNFLTAGTSNIAGAIIGGVTGLVSSVTQEVMRYKVGKVKPTVWAVTKSIGTVVWSTFIHTMVGGALGVPWALADTGRAAAQTYISYRSYKTYKDGAPTSSTTKWEVANAIVGIASPNLLNSATAVRSVTAGLKGVYNAVSIVYKGWRRRRAERAARRRYVMGALKAQKPGAQRRRSIGAVGHAKMGATLQKNRRVSVGDVAKDTKSLEAMRSKGFLRRMAKGSNSGFNTAQVVQRKYSVSYSESSDSGGNIITDLRGMSQGRRPSKK